MNRLIVYFLLVILLISCNSSESPIENEPLKIVCTTGMLADAARNIAGEKAVVQALMGPSTDPHLYKATREDLEKLSEADVIFYNGLHLEGKMGEVLKNLSRQKEVVAVSDGVDITMLIKLEEFDDAIDPHIWFDIAIWKDAVYFMSSVIEELDTANAGYYQGNYKVYASQLDDLDQWAKEKIESIPLINRILVTAHDAFEYFGRAYTMQVIGLQGLSTMSEYGLRDVTNLVDFVVYNKIKAVFLESSVPPRSIEAVINGCRERDHEVVIGGTLYSDAMGADGTEEGTYIGMFRHNVNTIYNALHGTEKPV